jgi:DNA-binding MarR family transcriptional regulator
MSNNSGNESSIESFPIDRARIVLGEQLSALLSASHALELVTATQFDVRIQAAAFRIVRWLYAYGDTNLQNLAKSVDMDQGAASRLVKQLVRFGYVQIERSEHDRRQLTIAITQDGRERTYQALSQKGLDFYSRTADWTEFEILSLAKLLERLNSAQNDSPPAGSA